MVAVNDQQGLHMVADSVQLNYERRFQPVIGKRLRFLRREKNYSLRKLAQLTGLSHSFICDIEQGRCNPSIENLRVIASALESKAEFFLHDMVANNDQAL
jgi:transcriptional regulator with XRE-family HTH domain